MIPPERPPDRDRLEVIRTQFINYLVEQFGEGYPDDWDEDFDYFERKIREGICAFMDHDVVCSMHHRPELDWCWVCGGVFPGKAHRS